MPTQSQDFWNWSTEYTRDSRVFLVVQSPEASFLEHRLHLEILPSFAAYISLGYRG
jgi:hypothetical protein